VTRDLADYNFWLTKLNQFNGNFVQAEMVKAFPDSNRIPAKVRLSLEIKAHRVTA